MLLSNSKKKTILYEMQSSKWTTLVSAKIMTDILWDWGMIRLQVVHKSIDRERYSEGSKIISITKFSIVIGSPCAYLSHNQRAITWMSNYSCPICTFYNRTPVIGYPRDFHANFARFKGYYYYYHYHYYY